MRALTKKILLLKQPFFYLTAERYRFEHTNPLGLKTLILQSHPSDYYAWLSIRTEQTNAEQSQPAKRFHFRHLGFVGVPPRPQLRLSEEENKLIEYYDSCQAWFLPQIPWNSSHGTQTPNISLWWERQENEQEQREGKRSIWGQRKLIKVVLVRSVKALCIFTIACCSSRKL